MVANMAEVKEHKASFAAALRQAKMNIPESDQPNGATARFTSAAHMVMAAVKCALSLLCPVFCLCSSVTVFMGTVLA